MMRTEVVLPMNIKFPSICKSNFASNAQVRLCVNAARTDRIADGEVGSASFGKT